MRYCTTVLLMQVEVMYSGPVVIMFLTWYTNEGKKKTRRKSPIQQLVLSSGRGRERVPKLPERSDAPFALPLKAKVEKQSMVSYEGEQIGACSKIERALGDC